jgi:ketosteroid isomerase-like protein
MRLARGIVLLGVAYALAGCGNSAHDDVRAKVEQFAHATANRDYSALCGEVLAPTLVQRLTDAGVSCRQAMKLFVQSVRNPTLRVARITVKGHTASATVVAAATGQASARESIQLIETEHGWRLASLASPS